MAADSSEMDSLFEGMDFVLPSEDEPPSQLPEDSGPRNGNLESEPLKSNGLIHEGLKPSFTTPEPALTSSSSPQNPVGQSRSSASDLPSTLSSFHTLDPRPLSPTNRGVPLDDTGESLEDDLFNGLAIAPSVPDDSSNPVSVSEAAAILANEAKNLSGAEVAPARTMSTVSSLDKLPSADVLVGEGKVGNVEDETSIQSILGAYSDFDVKDLKSAPSGTPPNSRTDSGVFLSPTVSVQKPSIRRKKRSLKIGYGREVEENEELNVRKTGSREAIGVVPLGTGSVNAGSAPSVARYSLSKDGSQDVLQTDQYTAGFGLNMEGSSYPNGVELTKQTSDSRLSESQYSTLEVQGIERVASREISEEMFLMLSSNKHEVVTASHSDILVDASVKGEESDFTAVGDTSVVVEIGKEDPETEYGGIASNLGMRTPSMGMPYLGESTLREEEMHFELTIEQKGGSVEERLQLVQEIIDDKMNLLHEKVSSLSALRKAARQKRRRAGEKLAEASARLKQLEAELDAACEGEDFDTADALSGEIVAQEADMTRAGEDLNVAEAACDSLASQLQEVLEFQAATEEKGAKIFETVKQEAQDAAEEILKNAQEAATQKAERLLMEEKTAEIKASELDLELRDLEEAKAKLNKTIEGLTSLENQEKEALIQKRQTLVIELEELLDMVKVKEAEITECDERIAAVEQKVTSVAYTFEEQSKGLRVELEARTSSYLQLQNDCDVISDEKREIEHALDEAEVERQSFLRIAGLAGDASIGLRESAEKKKTTAMAIKQSREKRAELAEKEKQFQADLLLLRQNSSSTRSVLQDLTSTKAKLNQETTAVMERISFAEKKGPELDNEKKLAAAARNFKVAGRLAAEARTLAADKAAACAEMERITKELENVDREAEVTVCTLSDLDALLLAKEKEIGMARCQRLRLVAAAARDERDFASEAHDSGEVEALGSEAAGADTEADRLQNHYQLEGIEYENQSKIRSQENHAVGNITSAISDVVSPDEQDAALEHKEHLEVEILHVELEAAEEEVSGTKSDIRAEAIDKRDKREAAVLSDDFEEAGLRDNNAAVEAKAEAERLQKLLNLRSVAAVERDKRDAAVLVDDFDGAELHDNNAEAAEAEADRLQKLFNLQGIQYESQQQL